MKWLWLFFPFLCCADEVIPSYSQLKHREHQGVGYKEGYSSIAVHLTFADFSKWASFFDPRGHVFNDGRLAFNVGLGGRLIGGNEMWMVGGNIYYDYRTSSTLSPQQLGGGLELFMSDYAFRLNGYAPIGIVKQREGNRSAVALANLQGEVEKELLRGEDHLFEGAIGIYYLSGRAFQNQIFGKAWGSDLRLTARLWNRVEILFETTYDRIFHFTFQGMLSLTIPFGERRKEEYSRFNLYRPIKRWEIIPLQKKHL